MLLPLLVREVYGEQCGKTLTSAGPGRRAGGRAHARVRLSEIYVGLVKKTRKLPRKNCHQDYVNEHTITSSKLPRLAVGVLKELIDQCRHEN